jgi:hypothetical protein
LTKDSDDTDEFFVLEHRHADRGANTGDLNCIHHSGMTLSISVCCGEVMDVNRAPGLYRRIEDAARRWLERSFSANLGKHRRHIVSRCEAEPAPFIKIEGAELRFTNARGVLQHCPEHCL